MQTQDWASQAHYGGDDNSTDASGIGGDDLMDMDSYDDFGGIDHYDNGGTTDDFNDDYYYGIDSDADQGFTDFDYNQYMDWNGNGDQPGAAEEEAEEENTDDQNVLEETQEEEEEEENIDDQNAPEEEEEL